MATFDVSEVDVSYAQAVPNLSMPFASWSDSPGGGEPRLLDAVYIPTQSHRPPPCTDLDLLVQHVVRVYLLFSEEPASWAVDLDSERVTVLKDLRSYCNLDRLVDHPTTSNPSYVLHPQYDIPAKRTFALQHARQKSFEHIGFLDDDIYLDFSALTAVRRALCGGVDVASFHVLDYPDVSTVDHIERILFRCPSQVSIGGNCLFVRTLRTESFFPLVYNDDWLFLFRHMMERSVVSLGTARQRPYEPWLGTRRIMHEQFGDILIEGLKRNIVAGRQPFVTSVAHWAEFLSDYRSRIEALRHVPGSEMFSECLAAALDVVVDLEPESFDTFIRDYLHSDKGDVAWAVNL